VTRTRFIAFLATATIVFSGCGGGAVPSPAATSATSAVSTATAEGFDVSGLGAPTISALPKGTLYVQYLEIPQPAGGSLAHAHIAGFVYAIVGTHRLAIVGGETKDLTPSEAGVFPRADRQVAFVPADAAHTHSNPGTAPNLWYFISIRPNTARTAVPTFPGQKEVFATPDLPPLPDGAYTETLVFLTVQPSGRTEAHKHGGIETILVLDGSVEVHVQGAPTRTLAKGEGTFIPADTPMQIWNKGAATAKFLAFFVTANEKAFRTNVDTSP